MITRDRTVSAFLYARRLVREDLPLEEIENRAALVIESIDLLADRLREIEEDVPEEEIQSIYYEAGKVHFSSDLRWWFAVLYEMLLGQKEGPRLGQFTRIMTADWVANQITHASTSPWRC